MKYILEDDINFYDELSMISNDVISNDEISNDDNECLITLMPLSDNHVTLECNHKFNYMPLYTEIFQQKFVYKTYSPNMMNRPDFLLLKKSKSDFFIRCPYCRNMQFTIIPYYPEFNVPKRYGINSIDSNYNEINTPYISNIVKNDTFGSALIYANTDFGLSYTKGKCCEIIHDNYLKQVLCHNEYVIGIPETNLSYCHEHYKQGFNNYKQEQHQKIKKNKIDIAIKLKAEKLKIKAEKQQIKEEKQQIKEEKLKIKAEKLKTTTELSTSITINNPVQECCKTILTTGFNKGKICGIKKINSSCLCFRHQKKLDKK